MNAFRAVPTRLARQNLQLPAALLLGLCGAAGLAGASTQDERDFDIPAGPLGSTLVGIARVAGTLVSFSPDLVAQRQAPAIRGRLSLQAALTLATRPNGLAFDVTPAGTLTIRPVTLEVPEATVPAADPAAPRVDAVLPAVEVIGSRPADGLRALRGRSATRTDTALADLPQAVSVLTSDLLALQGGSSSLDALGHVTGISGTVDTSGTGGLVLPALQLRGLPAAFALSGLPTIRGGFPIDLAFVERIEVTKGPSALVAGIAEAGGRGGVVDLVRKQAEPGLPTTVTQSLSSQDGGTLRVSADLGGEWGNGPLWRLAGYGSQSGRTEGGYTHQGGAGLLGTLSYQRGGASAAITLQVDRNRSTPAPASRGGQLRLDVPDITPVQEGQVAPLDPNDRVLSSSADLELELAWRFASDWRVSWKGRVEGQQNDLRRHQVGSVPLDGRNTARSAALQWSLLGTLSTGPVDHRLLLALDAQRRRTVRNGVAFNGDPNALMTLENSDLKQALLLQDQASLGPWRLQLGVQRAYAPLRLQQVRSPVPAGAEVLNVNDPGLRATNWDVGVLRRLSPGVSVYAGSQYTVENNGREGFAPADGGAPLPFTSVRQAQAGLKFDFDRRLGLTLEAYRLRQHDSVLSSVTLPLGGLSADGMEIELSGRATPDIDLHVGLNLMRTSDLFIETLDPLRTFRSQAVGVPRESLQMLLRYRLPGELLPQSSLGVALRASSSRVVIPPFPSFPGVQLSEPGGMQLDLSWDRSVGPWSINAFVNNVFDRQLYGPASSFLYVPLLPGRSVRLAATYRE